MSGNIPADAVVAFGAMREDGRKSEPTVRIDHGQEGPRKQISTRAAPSRSAIGAASNAEPRDPRCRCASRRTARTRSVRSNERKCAAAGRAPPDPAARLRGGPSQIRSGGRMWPQREMRVAVGVGHTRHPGFLKENSVDQARPQAGGPSAHSNTRPAGLAYHVFHVANSTGTFSRQTV